MEKYIKTETLPAFKRFLIFPKFIFLIWVYAKKSFFKDIILVN